MRALFAKFSRLIGVLISYSWWLGWNLEVMLQLLLLWKALCKLMPWRPRLQNSRRSIQHDWVEYSIDKPPSRGGLLRCSVLLFRTSPRSTRTYSTYMYHSSKTWRHQSLTQMLSSVKRGVTVQASRAASCHATTICRLTLASEGVGVTWIRQTRCEI